MKLSTLTLLASMTMPLLVPAAPAPAQTRIFTDDFNGPSYDSGLWNLYDSSRIMNRSRLGNAPTIGSDNGNGYAHLRLDTYDPTTPGADLRGTEMLTRQTFNLGSGLEFEARLRAPGLPRGVVVAFFPLGEQGVYPDSYMKTEIDYEFLANQSRSQLWLNIWDDYNPQRGGPNSVVNPSVTNLDWSGWNTYKIRWLPDHTDWLVNGVVVRHETTVLPASPMQAHFNIWVPSSGWTTAYDGGLQPAASAQANRSYYLDVDYLHVTTIPPATGTAVGSGTGLSAIYYDNPDFTGATVSRIDPRIHFNWGSVGPDPALGNDTFSARWTGLVQPEHNETYTFYTNTDDGVRLWVNNQLLIDHWQAQAATEYSATMALTAGSKYAIKMESFQGTGASVAELRWSSPSTPKQLIPQSQLYPNDGTPPAVTISVPGPLYSYTSLAQATGTAIGNNGVQAVRGRLFRYSDNSYWNGTSWGAAPADAPAAGTSSWTFAMPALADGKYSLQATATDSAGNSGSSAAVDFYIDNSAPALVVTAPQTNASYPGLAQATGTCTDTAPGVAEVRGRIFRYADSTYWNGTAWVASVVDLPVAGVEYWSMNLPPLTNGKYNYLATAQDFVGNNTSAGVDFVVDSTPHWRAVDIAAGPDNKTRVLLNHSDGRAGFWVVGADGTFEVANNYGPFPGWHAARIAVGADLKTRIMWVHQDGRVALWVLSPGNQTAGGGALEVNNTYGPYSGWSAAGFSCAADNKMRLLWRNPNGQAALWLVAPGNQGAGGGGLESNVTYGAFAGWMASAISSGSDNKLRVLWTSTDGSVAAWVIGSGGGLEVNNTYGPYPGWSAQSLAVGADGQSRLLWTHNDGRAALWVLASGDHTAGGGALLVNNTYGPYSGWGARTLASGGDNLMRAMWTASDARTALWVVAAGDQKAGGGALAFNDTFGPF